MVIWASVWTPGNLCNSNRCPRKNALLISMILNVQHAGTGPSNSNLFNEIGATYHSGELLNCSRGLHKENPSLISCRTSIWDVKQCSCDKPVDNICMQAKRHETAGTIKRVGKKLKNANLSVFSSNYPCKMKV